MFAQPYLRFPGGKARALTFSYDDGVEQDQRLKQLFDRHGLKGTFNLNSRMFAPERSAFPPGTVIRRMTRTAALRCFQGGEHEIGFHGCTHPYLNRLPKNRQAQEIAADREALEGMFGGLVRGGAYPFGTYNADTLAVLESQGAAYCRTVESSHSFQLPENWLTLRPTCHHGDPELMALAKRFLEEPAERNPYLFYIWGHAYEFERDDTWNVIEALAAYLGGREDVYYATNIELYDYVQAFSGLRFTMDGLTAQNPWCRSVWFSHLGQTYELRPGEGITLPKESI